MFTLNAQATDQQIAQTILDYIDIQPVRNEKMELCFKWLNPHCESLFHASFHQLKLAEFVERGYLERTSTSKGGKKVYYTVKNFPIFKALFGKK